MTLNAAIFVDEVNAVSQLHALNIEGIRPWRRFYDALALILKKSYEKINVEYHFYGALPPREVDAQRFFKRKRFFEALERDRIHVHKGVCQPSINGRLHEKGVDMLLGLDLFEMSLAKYDLLFVFSGDGDFAPAIERARRNSKVVAILGEQQPARLIKRIVDSVTPLEGVIALIDEQYIVRRPNQKTQTNPKRESVAV